MARTKRKATRQSPYVKYAKRPFPYQHKNCKHGSRVIQAVPATNQHDGWRGEVCASCNVIIRKFDSNRREDRFAA